MIEAFVEKGIDHLKPTMKALKSIEEISLTDQTLVSAKVDGEFTLVVYDRNGESYTFNKWGHKRTDFPALNELLIALNQTDVQTAELLAELYAEEKGKPLQLPNYLHYIKSGNQALINKIHMGIWDLISLNGQPLNTPLTERYTLIESWLQNLKTVKLNPLVNILPYITPKTKEEIQKFWQEYVTQKGYEGIVIRNNGELYKLKPKGEFDAVIIGINKETLFEQKQVQSLKLAVMDEQGNFIEVGDCASGLTKDLHKALWKLTDFKVGEDHETVYVKPIVIVQVEYTETYTKERRVLKFDGTKYMEIGTKPYVSLRHPRLLRFRPDKTVNPKDLRETQIPNGKPLTYTLYQGDCRKILPTLKSESIDLIITSPPYYKVKEYGNIEGEIGVKGNVEQYQKDLLEVLKECYRLLTPNGVLCLNLDKGGEFSVWDFIPKIKELSFILIDTIIWYDRTRRREAGYPHLSHSYEPVFILTKTRNFTFNKASLHQNDVWEFAHYKGTTAQKGDVWDRMTVATFPIKLVEELMSLYSNLSDVVLDPFMGSGTVMNVSQRLGRSCVGVEINPEYCEIIRERCFNKYPQHKYVFIV